MCTAQLCIQPRLVWNLPTCNTDRSAYCYLLISPLCCMALGERICFRCGHRIGSRSLDIWHDAARICGLLLLGDVMPALLTIRLLAAMPRHVTCSIQSPVCLAWDAQLRLHHRMKRNIVRALWYMCCGTWACATNWL